MSSPKGGPPQPVGPYIPYPGDEPEPPRGAEAGPPRGPDDDERRRLAIARRELNAFAQHVRRSREAIRAQYEQLARLQVQLDKREDKLRGDDERLAALRANLEQRQKEQDDRHRALDQRQREVDQRARDLDQRQRVQEERLRAQTDQHQRALEAKRQEETGRQAAELAQLDRRARDLQAEIARDQKRLADQRAELEKRRQELEAAQKQQRERWAAETAEMEQTLAGEAERIAQDRQGLAQAEAALQKRREEVARMTAELKELQEGERRRASKEEERLRQEVTRLQQQLTDREHQLHEALQAAATVPELDAEPEPAPVLPARAAGSRPRGLSGVLPTHPEPVPATPAEEELAAEAPAEEQAVEAPAEEGAATDLPDEVTAEAAEEAGEPADTLDLEGCEARLGEFRKLLQADRHAAEEDLRHLQTHRGDEAPANPPRAPLALQVQQLAQLRHEIHSELDRLQREQPGMVPTPGTLLRAPAQKPVPKHPTPTTKSRGTFLGLRRWLSGG